MKVVRKLARLHAAHTRHASAGTNPSLLGVNGATFRSRAQPHTSSARFHERKKMAANTARRLLALGACRAGITASASSFSSPAVAAAAAATNSAVTTAATRLPLPAFIHLSRALKSSKSKKAKAQNKSRADEGRRKSKPTGPPVDPGLRQPAARINGAAGLAAKAAKEEAAAAKAAQHNAAAAARKAHPPVAAKAAAASSPSARTTSHAAAKTPPAVRAQATRSSGDASADGSVKAAKGSSASAKGGVKGRGRGGGGGGAAKGSSASATGGVGGGGGGGGGISRVAVLAATAAAGVGTVVSCLDDATRVRMQFAIFGVAPNAPIECAQYINNRPICSCLPISPPKCLLPSIDSPAGVPVYSAVHAFIVVAHDDEPRVCFFFKCFLEKLALARATPA